MNCSDFELVANEQLDQRSVNLPADWAMHVNDCPACHMIWSELLHIHRTASTWKKVPSDVNLSSKVFDRWATEQHSLQELTPGVSRYEPPFSALSPTWERWPALLISALAILAMTGIGWSVSSTILWTRQTRFNTANIAHTNASGSQNSQENERQLELLLNDARAAYSELASDAWLHVSAASLLVPPTEAATPFRREDLGNGIPDSLSRPLEPLRHELREVLDLLLGPTTSSEDSST